MTDMEQIEELISQLSAEDFEYISALVNLMVIDRDRRRSGLPVLDITYGDVV